MLKTAVKTPGKIHTSSKLHRYLKKSPHVNITLKDVQKSLSNIGVSLSKRVTEERAKK